MPSQDGIAPAPAAGAPGAPIFPGTTQPPAAPQPPATPRRSAASVSVAIDTTPPGAAVWLGSRVLGMTPFRDSFQTHGATIRLIVRLEGYVDATVLVRGDGVVVEALELTPVPVRPRADHDRSVNPVPVRPRADHDRSVNPVLALPRADDRSVNPF